MSEIIWTNHAKERNKERQITQGWVENTINAPDKTTKLEDGKVEYRKKFNNQTVAVVCKKSREGKYLVLSSWINPPNYGTPEYKNKFYDKQLKKAGGFKKFWLTLLRQIGI